MAKPVTIMEFVPAQPERKGNRKQIPDSFLVILDPETAKKYFDYCTENKVSGTQVIVQLITKLVS